MADSDDQAKTMIANLEKNSGKSLAQWVALAKKAPEQKHGAMVKHLKSEHGLTHGYANLVAHKTLKSDAGSADGDDLIAAQYEGAKAHLRPIYDALLAGIDGESYEVAPKKAYVSLRRAKQFATLHPSTKTRFDLGLNLKGVEPAGRLEAAGSWNTMVSHRVKLASADEVDAEVIGWLRQAMASA